MAESLGGQNHILAQNLDYDYYYRSPTYPNSGYMTWTLRFLNPKPYILYPYQSFSRDPNIVGYGLFN